MNKKKKKTNLFIIIVMLILLIISSYIIYDKFLQSPKDTNIINQKSKENSNQNQQNSIRKLRKEEQDILLDQIKKYNLSFASSYPFTDSKLLKNQTTLMFALKMTTKTGQDLMESDIEKEREVLLTTRARQSWTAQEAHTLRARPRPGSAQGWQGLLILYYK